MIGRNGLDLITFDKGRGHINLLFPFCLSFFVWVGFTYLTYPWDSHASGWRFSFFFFFSLSFCCCPAAEAALRQREYSWSFHPFPCYDGFQTGHNVFLFFFSLKKRGNGRKTGQCMILFLFFFFVFLYPQAPRMNDLLELSWQMGPFLSLISCFPPRHAAWPGLVQNTTRDLVRVEVVPLFPSYTRSC